MTRVYNDGFRCGLCLKRGSIGWLYRCTQDRELLIEDDLEHGYADVVDNLATILSPSASPKKRSPAVRTSSSLAFLDEISELDLQSYSPTQISIVLHQRAQLLEVAREGVVGFGTSKTEGLGLDLPPKKGLYPVSMFSTPTKMKGPEPKKPWLPTQECQFKCCPACRPLCHERSYLSLNAIADGELPATAVTGFGFQYQKRRPVALVEHVRNLGLRPIPPPPSRWKRKRMSQAQLGIKPSPPRKDLSMAELAILNGPFNDDLDADTTFGQLSNAYDSTAMTRNLNVEVGSLAVGDGSAYGSAVQKVFGAMSLLQQDPMNSDVNHVKTIETAHDTGVARRWTPPPNSPEPPPKDKGVDLIVGGTTAYQDIDNTSSPKLKRLVRSRFNLADWHGNANGYVPEGLDNVPPDIVSNEPIPTLAPKESILRSVTPPKREKSERRVSFQSDTKGGLDEIAEETAERDSLELIIQS